MLKSLLAIRIAAFGTQLTNSTSRRKGAGSGKAAGFALLFLFILVSVGMMFYEVFSAMAQGLHDAGLNHVYFAFFALAAFVVMFVFSVFTAKSQLFEARDNELLLALPIPPRTILASRLLLLIGLNLLLELAVAIPAALCGSFSGGMAVAAFVLICLALPLFSTAISSLFGWIIAKIAARTRHKSAVSTVLALIFLAVYFYFYIGFINNGMADLLSGSDAITGIASRVAPLLWLGRAMADGEALSLLLSLACLLIPFIAAYVLLSLTFIRTVTEKSRAAKLRYEEKSLTVSSASRALTRKELGRFTASSVYMLNAGLGLVFLLAGGVALLLKKSALLAMAPALGSLCASLPVMLAAAIALLHSMITLTAPSISLEGQSLWIGQSLPVDPFTVIWAKAKLQLGFSLPVSVIVSLCAIYASEPDVLTALLMILYPAAFAFLMALVGLIANLCHPNFTWINETQVVKQGVSVLITMLGGMVASLALGGLSLYLARLGYPMAGLGGASVLCVVAGAVCYRWLRKRGGAIYAGLC